MVLQRFLHFIRSRTRHIHPLRNRILLVPKPISIILYKHVADSFFIMQHLLFLFSVLGWLTDDIRDDLLQILIVELCLLVFLFDVALYGFCLRWEKVSSWTRNGIHCLFHLRVNTLPGLIFEDAGRLRLSMMFRMRSVLVDREVKVISDILVDGVCRLPVVSKRVSFVEGVPPVVLGLVEWCLIGLVLFVMMQHILLFFGNQEPIFCLTAWMRGDS